MPQGAFSQSHPPTKPPAYCFTKKVPLLPLLPGMPPPQMQGSARWTDLDPEIPLDIAWYCGLKRRNDDLYWSGSITKLGITCWLVLEQTAAPNTWKLELRIEDYYAGPESWFFSNIQLDYDNNWDTGDLTYIWVPDTDYRLARVSY